MQLDVTANENPCTFYGRRVIACNIRSYIPVCDIQPIQEHNAARDLYHTSQSFAVENCSALIERTNCDVLADCEYVTVTACVCAVCKQELCAIFCNIQCGL